MVAAAEILFSSEPYLRFATEEITVMHDHVQGSGPHSREVEAVCAPAESAHEMDGSTTQFPAASESVLRADLDRMR